MRKEVYTLNIHSSLKEAWTLFQEHEISGAPVINRQGELVGVLSQHDLARRALSQGDPDLGKPAFYYMLPSVMDSLMPADESKSEMLSARVEEAMNPYVVTVAPDDTVSTVIETMKSHHVHRVIVAQGKKIVGLISTFDLLDLI
jgi:DHA2 family lincomycin resistance protein-like MFS transporter